MTPDASSDAFVRPLSAAENAKFDAALADVRKRFGSTYGLMIGGEDVETHRARTKHSPSDRGLVLGHFAAATEYEVDLAIAAASAAFPAWAATAESERRGVVRRLLGKIEARAFELAVIVALESGKTRRAAIEEVWGAAEVITAYCDEWASHGFLAPGRTPSAPPRPMVPHGVWTVFSPSYHPFGLAAGPVAAALLAGNTVVLKTAEETPFSARLLAEMLRACGVPKGVFNLISGAPEDMGDAMFNDPRIDGTTYAGARRAGERLTTIMHVSHPPRPIVARLNSTAVHIVTAHADLDAAARRITIAAFGLGEDRAHAPTHLFVHQDIADALIERLTASAARVRIGDPLLPDTDMGPIPAAEDYADFRTVTHKLHAYGARVLFGGHVLHEGGHGAGNFVAPTLAEVPTNEHPCWSSEVLLPVIMLRRYRMPDRAVATIAELPGTPTVEVHGDASEVTTFLTSVANTTKREYPSPVLSLHAELAQYLHPAPQDPA